MKNLPLLSTVPAAPSSPVVRVLPSTVGVHAGQSRMGRWWRAVSRLWRSVQVARAPQARPLEAEDLSPHLQRDLNLHDNAESWLQTQKAWRQYEHYRDLQAWRSPL